MKKSKPIAQHWEYYSEANQDLETAHFDSQE